MDKKVYVYTTVQACKRTFSMRKTSRNWVAGFWSVQEHDGACWLSYTAKTQHGQPKGAWLERNRPLHLERLADIALPVL